MRLETATSPQHPGESGGEHPGPIARLVRLLTSERRDIAIVIMFAVGVGVLTLATPAAVQALVNIVSFGGVIQPLVILSLLLLAFLSLAAAIRAIKAYIVELLQRRLFVRVVLDLSQRLPRVRSEAYDRDHGPELVNRFFDVMTVQKVGASLLLDAVAVVLQGLIGLIILAFYHPLLLAFDVVLILGIVVVLFVLGRGAVRTAITESKAKYAVAASLEEIARNPTTFKQAGGPAFARARADALAVEYVMARRRHFRVVLRQIIGSLALQTFAATALLAIGGWLVIQGQLTLGQLVAAELIVSIVLASFAKLGQKLESFYDLLAAVDKLGHLLDLPVERSGGLTRNVAQTGAALRLRDVSFNYDSGLPALRGLSLALEPGQRLCIIGGNGSGKSTLADLLHASRTPSSGTIELDGVDFRELSLETIRREVALVKGFEIVEDSIEQNVRMNRAHVCPDDVRKILSALGLLDEIRLLPDGLATRLASSGAPLSYGQARRLMLARAIAGRPRLLVADDLLDGLDAEARQRTMEVLLSPSAPWSLILLTHDESASSEFPRTFYLDSRRPAAAPDSAAPLEAA